MNDPIPTPKPRKRHVRLRPTLAEAAAKHTDYLQTLSRADARIAVLRKWAYWGIPSALALGIVIGRLI